MRDHAIAEEALRHAATLPVLGIPVRLRADHAPIVAAFERSYGYWRVLEARPDLVAHDRVEGRLVLHSGDEGAGARPAVRHRLVDPRRLLIGTPGSVCASDADRREFTGWITAALLESGVHFRRHVLEALVLSVVTWLDRTPVHASAVVRDGSALLLAGPSGRGKSTLTWAAAGAGLQVLADDMVFVQLEPLRIWGNPTFLHLPEASRRFFPELAGVPVGIASSGKEKIVIDLPARGAASALPVVERAGVCVLERGAPAPRWRRLGRPELRAALGKLDAGFELFEGRYASIVTALAAHGGWAFDPGPDPHAGAAALHALLDAVEEAA